MKGNSDDTFLAGVLEALYSRVKLGVVREVNVPFVVDRLDGLPPQTRSGLTKQRTNFKRIEIVEKS